MGRPRLGRWVRGRRREQEEAEGGSARPGPGGSCQGGTGGGLRSSEGLGPRGGSPADSWGQVGFGLWRPFSPWVDGDAVAGRVPGTSGAPQVSPFFSGGVVGVRAKRHKCVGKLDRGTKNWHKKVKCASSRFLCYLRCNPLQIL